MSNTTKCSDTVLVPDEPLNKELVARFVASNNPYSLPTISTRLEDLDSFDIDVILEHSISFGYKNQVLVIVPNTPRNGKYSLTCYGLNTQQYTLYNPHYNVSFTTLSNLLEAFQWNGGRWVKEEKIKEVMEQIPDE